MLLKHKHLKTILIWIINSMLFILLAGRGYYISSKNHPHLPQVFNLPNSEIKIIIIIIACVVFYLLTLIITFVLFKIAKYLAFKTTKIKLRYLIFFIIFYIEMIFLVVSLDWKINYFLIGLYVIVFIVQDYLFSKLYKRFNTLRVVMLNSFYIISLQIIMDCVIIYK